MQIVYNNFSPYNSFHEKCVLEVTNYLRHSGYGVTRNGYHDILCDDITNKTRVNIYDMTSLTLRAFADLKAIKNDLNIFVEIKTQVNSNGFIYPEAFQWAHFIQNFNEKHERTIYCYFKQDGLDKAWDSSDDRVISKIDKIWYRPFIKPLPKEAIDKIHNTLGHRITLDNANETRKDISADCTAVLRFQDINHLPSVYKFLEVM